MHEPRPHESASQPITVAEHIPAEDGMLTPPIDALPALASTEVIAAEYGLAGEAVGSVVVNGGTLNHLLLRDTPQSGSTRLSVVTTEGEGDERVVTVRHLVPGKELVLDGRGQMSSLVLTLGENGRLGCLPKPGSDAFEIAAPSHIMVGRYEDSTSEVSASPEQGANERRRRMALAAGNGALFAAGNGRYVRGRLVSGGPYGAAVIQTPRGRVAINQGGR
jgi:hypothetical protein